jgi:hypothetical protein
LPNTSPQTFNPEEQMPERQGLELTANGGEANEMAGDGDIDGSAKLFRFGSTS